MNRFLSGLLLSLACSNAEPLSEALAEKPTVRAQPAAPLAEGFLSLTSAEHPQSLLAVWPRADGALLVGEDGAIATSDGKTLRHLTPSLPKALPERLLAAAANERVIVIVGERGLLLRSTDNGRTWSRSQMPVRATMRAAIATKSGDLWVAGDDSRAFRSRDDGETWTTTWFPRPLTANSIAESPTGGLYVACPRGTLFYSADQETWAELPLPKTPQVIFDVWVAPSGNIYLSGSDGYLSKSTDGKKWSRVELKSRADLHSLYAKDEDNLYAAGEKGTLLYSNNQGRSWAPQKTGTNATLTKIIGAPDGALLALGHNGVILRSSDGSSWEAAPSPTRQPLYGGLSTPKGLFAIGDNGALLTSQGDQWAPLTSADAPTLRAVWSDGARSYAAGDDGALYASDDGERFARLDVALGNGPLRAVLGDKGAVYVASGAKVITSLDQGKTWRHARLSGCSQVEQLSATASRLFARCPEALFASTDQGQTWLEQSVKGPLSFMLVVDGALLVASQDALRASSDEGASWRELSQPTRDDTVSIWASTSKRLFLATEQKLFQSEDGGASWRQLSLVAPQPIRALSGNEGHLFLSGDHGMLLVRPFKSGS